MISNEQRLDIDATLILLGLGYASTFLVAIGWVATTAI